MEVQHQEDINKGSFSIQKAGAILAEMTYVYAGEKRIIIDHTEVTEDLRGQGAGKKLVEAAVQFARAKEIHILPLCPFAKSVFNKEPSLRDVL